MCCYTGRMTAAHSAPAARATTAADTGAGDRDTTVDAAARAEVVSDAALATAGATARSPWSESFVAGELSFLLARANALSLGASNAALKQFGLKVRSYPVLSLACDDLLPTQRELADFLRLDPSQVVAIIDDLERRGLVERHADERDRRSKVLVPTAEGRRVARVARAAASAAEIAPFSGLSAVERETLTQLLARVAFPAG